ncbi:MAG: GNAT family N-acetyltransferase [Chloroflexota bacterium]|nr:GNAT family N-acetyltransferase [Chloroflexota bacterium]
MTTIRAWEDDAATVDALLAAIWGNDPTLALFATTPGPDRDEPGSFRRSLCAVDDGGTLVGVGTLWENGLHPSAWRITIHVAAPWRRQGIGSRLFEALTALAPEPRPLGSGTRETDRTGCGFLAAHGFEPVMRTRRGVFSPSDIPASLTEELAAAEARVLAAGYQIVTLPEATRRGIGRREIARLHVEVYWDGHAWDRPRPVAEAEAAMIFLDEADLLPGEMHLALDGTRPVAVASLRRSALPEEPELGWAGAGSDVAAHENDLAFAVVGRCLAHATAVGWRLHFEADEGDGWWWRLLNRIPARLEDDWLNFRRR